MSIIKKIYKKDRSQMRLIIEIRDLDHGLGYPTKSKPAKFIKKNLQSSKIKKTKQIVIKRKWESNLA